MGAITNLEIRMMEERLVVGRLYRHVCNCRNRGEARPNPAGCGLLTNGAVLRLVEKHGDGQPTFELLLGWFNADPGVPEDQLCHGGLDTPFSGHPGTRNVYIDADCVEVLRRTEERSGYGRTEDNDNADE